MNNILFRNLHNKAYNNNKGVTLSELLVSIAILGIVAAPFLGSFLAATNNNVSAKDKLYASTLAQKTMDDLKSRPNLLNSAAGQGIQIYPGNGAFNVKYTIAEEQIEVLPTGSDPYKFGMAGLDFCQVYNINEATVALNSDTFNLSSGGNTIKYYLRLLKDVALNHYHYTFYDGINPSLQQGELSISDDINIRINYINTGTALFELHVIKENTIEAEKKVNLYIVDDTNSRMKIINDGDLPIYQYYFSNSQSLEYNNTLYKIKVEVYKGVEKLTELISYVKKNVVI